MNATVLDLRRNMRRILVALETNERVVLTHRGRKKAVIVPCHEPRARQSAAQHAAFGMWKNRDDITDVNAFVRDLRKGRPI